MNDHPMNLLTEVLKRGARMNLLKTILEDMLAVTERGEWRIVNGKLPILAEPLVHVECSVTEGMLATLDEKDIYRLVLEPMLNALAGRLEQTSVGPLYMWHGEVIHEYRVDPSYMIAVKTTRKSS